MSPRRGEERVPHFELYFDPDLLPVRLMLIAVMLASLLMPA